MGKGSAGRLGVRYTEEDEVAQHRLGLLDCGTDGTQYVYLQAGEALTQYEAVSYDEAFSAVSLANSDTAAVPVAVPQIAVTNAYHFWGVCGPGADFQVLCGNTAANAKMYTVQGTAGTVDDNAGANGEKLVEGLRADGTNVAVDTTSATAVDCSASQKLSINSQDG